MYVIELMISSIFGAIVGAVTIFLLSKKSRKEDERKQNYILLFAYRDIFHFEFVVALNKVPLLYQDNKIIINTWTELMESYNTKSYIGEEGLKKQIEDIERNKKKLLTEIGCALKYNSIDWDVIGNSYVPQWLVAAQQRENNTNLLYQNLVQNIYEKNGEKK